MISGKWTANFPFNAQKLYPMKIKGQQYKYDLYFWWNRNQLMEMIQYIVWDIIAVLKK